MARKRMSDIRRRQLKRLRQFISRAEKRGYRFPEGFKESLPSLSTQKLKSFTAEKLYKNVATAISEKTGKIVKGSERRAEERSELAIKAAKTRIKGKLAETEEGKLLYDQFVNEELMRPYEPEPIDLDLEKESLINEGRIVYYNIQTLIESYPSAGSEQLRRALNEEIASYGFDRVCASLALAPEEAISIASDIIYYPSGGTTSAEAHRAFIKLGEIIKGTVPSEQDARTIGEILDSMGYGEE
ncbi:MAG: hypothetical protein UE295_12160 [Acutalibacteraceae bacterium]|nr:hypothetical protein [Acutalibacteraceae bacterium]